MLFRKRDDAPAVDEDALVHELQQLVSPATLELLAGSSDLPQLEPAAVACLLRRYLRAEQRSVAKAAKRLERQAAWRASFGSVTQVQSALLGREIVPLYCTRVL